MDDNETFRFNYSAKENEEIIKLKNKYLPQKESKLDELKRLDRYVQNSGMIEALCTGIGGALIFGLGMCLAMQIIVKSTMLVVLGIFLGVIGISGMLIAYPVYCKVFNKTKQKFAPRILELASELTGENVCN